MKKLLLSMSAVALMAGVSLSANALSLVYTVDVGAGFGMMSAPNVSGQSEIVNVPSSGFLNIVGSFVDFDVINDIVLGTDRGPNDPTDTITENFTYRIRVAEAGVIGNTVALGLEPAGNNGVTFAEFTQVGSYTLSNIRAGSVTGTFNTLFGGDIDDTLNPAAGEQSQATAFLPGFGDITVAFKSFDFPGAPQAVPPTGGITARQFEGVGGVTDRLIAVPEPGSVALLGGMLISGSAFLLRRRRR
jgi:hypothetical protein